MADNPKKPKDKAHVNLEEDGERQWWSQKLGVSQDELMKAVDTVGDSSAAVAKHLSKPDRA
jgi:hypothetical protein